MRKGDYTAELHLGKATVSVITFRLTCICSTERLTPLALFCTVEKDTIKVLQAKKKYYLKETGMAVKH